MRPAAAPETEARSAIEPTSGQAQGYAPVSGPLFAEVASAPALLSAHSPARNAPQRVPHWLVRTEMFLRAMLRIYLGLAVCYLPWNKVFWDQNPLFLQFPTLGVYAANGAVRGVVSGLGILNLWIALRDAIRRRKD